jgi:hypothetical protein
MKMPPELAIPSEMILVISYYCCQQSEIKIGATITHVPPNLSEFAQEKILLVIKNIILIKLIIKSHLLYLS